MLSRRTFWRLAAGLSALAQVAVRARAAAASILTVDARLSARGPDLGCPVVRKYRADAVVTLLGMPVFARKGVGAAFAAIRAAAEGERRLIALRFAGGSHPERTHGLLYDGSLEEIIVEHASTPERGSYFGFVTSSKDESYEQAKKRILNGKTGTYASYVAAAGVHIAGCARCETGRSRSMVRAGLSWLN